MASIPMWDELDRPQQKALARLFGGGSLLRIDGDLIVPLARRGYVNRDGLTALGEALCLAQLDAFRNWIYGRADHRHASQTANS